MNIQQCDKCGMRVVPKADGSCPSCQAVGVLKNLPPRTKIEPKPLATHSEPPNKTGHPTSAISNSPATGSLFNVAKFLFGLIWLVLLIIAGIRYLGYKVESERQQRDQNFEQESPSEPLRLPEIR